ncbi:MAG: ParB/RepB/Spo0J family partition protein [Coxiellaceae bacterium]|nr:ParB/RepB/Spo0J family partition protein [Coxiellaceae bacterium]
MTVTKRGLGRGLNDLGLDVLLSGVNTTGPLTDEELRNLPVEYLTAGKYQPRKDFDMEALKELAESIESKGIIQPLIVRRLGENRYEIIAGERRWRAAQLAGLKEVPTVIRDISDDSAMAMALIENIQRENLNSIEEAEAMQRLLNEFGMRHDEVAKLVGKSRSTITNLLRLLSLNDDVKTMLERGDLEMGHARAMLSLDNSQQIHAAKTVVEKGLSVRATEGFIRKIQEPTAKKPPACVDPDVQRLQNQLSDKLGAQVILQHTPSGRGKLVIKYNSLDEFEGILEHLGAGSE